jgi:GTPase SAR1 family protein
MSNTTDFLHKQEISYKEVPGGELVVDICPVAGCEGKFYINKEKGLYDCKKCQAKGNLFKFKSLYGVVEGVVSAHDLIGKEFKPMDPMQLGLHEALLWNNQNAIDYLHSRGFTDDTIRHFHLGYMADGQGEWIAIPYIQDGKLWNFKYRRFAGGDKTFKRIKDCATTLFNIDNIDYTKKGIVAVEGEMDAIAAWQMGITNVIGMTAGAGTFKPEWVKVFSQFTTTFLCLDSDEKGQTGARKVAEKIGLKKTKNVLLPVKDANEFLVTINDAGKFKALIGKATQFEVNNVGTMSDLVNKLDAWFDGTGGGIQGLQTGFSQFDNLTKGLKAGDLVIMSGDSGVGKTTLCNNIINNLVQTDSPVFYFSLEGQLEYYITRMMGAELERPYTELRSNPEEWDRIKRRMSSLPLYFYSGPQGGLTLEQMRELIPTVVNLYDIKCIVIDNLQKMVRGADTMYYQRLAEAVSVLKDMAVDCKIPIILIAHITKTNEDKKVITMHDVKGSSTIYQDADIFTILQVIKQKYYLSLDKNRMGEGGIHIELVVNKEIGLFKESGGEIVQTEGLGKTPRTNSS